MTDWRTQQGKINIGCILGAILVVLAIWVGIKTAPVIANMAEFKKTVSHEADRINVPGNNIEKMKKRILEKAELLEIPIGEKDIYVRKTKAAIQVRISYTVEIDYGFHVHKMSEDIDIDRPIF